MSFQITIYVLLDAVTAVLSAVVAVVAWQRRALPGGTWLALLLSSTVLWSLGAAVELAVTGLEQKILWSKIQYLGSVSAPVFYLLFAAEYNHLQLWLRRWVVALLFVVPGLTLALAATNELHHWIWTDFTPSPAGQNLLVYGHGPAFWVGMLGYSYLCVLGGTVLFAWAFLRFPRAYRRQAGILLVGAALPWVSNLVYVAGWSPLPGLDPTPMALALTGALSFWAMTRFGLLDVTPVARELLIETMRDGVIVLDDLDRVVDLNPAARRILGPAARGAIGRSAGSLLPDWQGAGAQPGDAEPGRTEVVLGWPAARSFELNVSRLRDRRGRFQGRLIVLRDVTDRKQAEQELQHMNETLRAQLVEIENLQAGLRKQAISDPLTGLFNRRYLAESFPRELARAAYQGVPLSVVMLDIDRFKEFNDTHGHRAGDDVLEMLARLLHTQSRRSDIACRYGGEEFVVILPGASTEAAAARAEQWRAKFEAARLTHNGRELKATFSCGVAAYPEAGLTMDQLFAAADGALYAAKAAGRNRVLQAPDIR